MPIISNFPGGSGRSSSGAALPPVKNIKTISAHEKVYVKWTDPKDTVVDGAATLVWDGTVLVRKAGSPPESRKDGVIVIDSKERDAYSNEYFCDGGLTNGVTYYYKLFPYTKSGVYTDSASNEFSVTPNPVYMGNISNASADSAGNGKLAIKWTDPDAMIVNDGVAAATWLCTSVAVKPGSYATDIYDPDIVYFYSSYTRNEYSASPLIATGLDNGKRYYVSFFPTSTDDAITVHIANRVTGTAGRLAISNVPSQVGTLVYTGNSQTPSWKNFNSDELTLDGDTDGTNAGVYTATFTPKKDYMWSGGSVSAKSIEWSIGRASISVPTTNSSFAYDGTQKSPSFVGYDSSKMTMSGDNTATEAGTYHVSFTPTDNYQWEDGSFGEKIVDWSISKTTISAIPTQDGVLEYNGNTQTPVWKNYNASQLSISGDTTGVSVGSYSVTFTPRGNYTWSDGSIAAKSVTWSISRATIPSAPSQSGTLTYTGNNQSPIWNNYNSERLTIGGTTSATDAGTYSATFTPTGNYRWSDGSTAAKTVSWTIDRAPISVPSANGSLVYTGSEQSPAWNNYDSAKMTIGGVHSSTNAGSHTATFTPASNYKWTDGSTSAKSVSWSISKAAGSLSLSKTSLSLSNSSPSGTISVTRTGNGSISASSSDSGVATVSVNGTTVTVTGVASGTATITVKVAAGTNHTAPSNKTVSVSVEMISTLENTSWAQIREVSKNNQGANYWSVGECKSVRVSGTVGTLSVSGTYYVFILGFNHNSSYEGQGIHFGCFKTSSSGGKDICLVDQYMNQNDGHNNKRFSMNHVYSSYRTNSGGWKGCDLRYDILGSTKSESADAETSTATSPVANTLMAALPSDLRSVMQPMSKYTDNFGDASSAASNVTRSIDYMSLLSEFEVLGSIKYANPTEQSYQSQYAYFKAGNSPVKYRHNSNTVTQQYWTRSAYKSDSKSFVAIGSNGSVVAPECVVSSGVTTVFKI